MAFTGDLEHLPIVDIIQLVHTTRKSGIFSVKSEKGESRIVFSSGYIVAANHINGAVRIGTVLVRSGAVAIDDLRQALVSAPAERKPLMAALMETGKLKREDALRALRQLVSLTIVELMNWTKGTFTFDTEAPIFPPGEGDDALLVDAQMVLMDALRIFDERERDRAGGKEVQPFETLYADVLPEVRAAAAASSAITAEDLGLGDLDLLEKKIPRPGSEMELFDPVAIHRQKIRELFPELSSEEQEAFVAFLKAAVDRKPLPDAAARQTGKALILFSGDKLLRHAVMTVWKEERLPVFATDDEKELDRTITQCFAAQRMPVVAFDAPGGPGGPSADTVAALRGRTRRKYPIVPLLQLTAARDAEFIVRSYEEGAWAVLPKPLKEDRRETFVQDMIRFLGSFTAAVRGFHQRPDILSRPLQELKKDIRALREVATPSDAAMVLLAAVADMFERSITFIVRPGELVGERAVGVSSDKSLGPTQADRLRIPLEKQSLFRQAVEKSLVHYGESGDEAVSALFREIGAPLSPVVVLLPLISDHKVMAVVYGDFGKKDPSPVQLDILEILAQQVGMALEYALFRRHAARAPQKP